jgi:hypothetical protein
MSHTAMMEKIVPWIEPEKMYVLGVRAVLTAKVSTY